MQPSTIPDMTPVESPEDAVDDAPAALDGLAVEEERVGALASEEKAVDETGRVDVAESEIGWSAEDLSRSRMHSLLGVAMGDELALSAGAVPDVAEAVRIRGVF